MKKTILTILLLAFCVSISGAGITDKLRAVIAAKNAGGGGACHSGPEYSDGFATPDNFTSENYGFTTPSGYPVLAFVGEAEHAWYDGYTTFTATQYGCFEITSVGGSAFDESGMVFRWTDEGARYLLKYTQSEGYLGWWYHNADTNVTSNGTLEGTSSGSITSGNGDRICFTIQGENAAIKLSVWENPTNNYPCDVDNWDSSSDAAEWIISDPVNEVNSGALMGIYFYEGGSLDIQFDNVTFGDLD